jgi:nucleoside-diphosphate-sugar epimerase
VPDRVRVAVTGASGALARAVWLAAGGINNIEVVRISRRCSDSTDDRRSSVEAYRGADLERSLLGCSALIHCAWNYGDESVDGTAEALEDVIAAATTAGVQRFVFPSSVAVYASSAVASAEFAHEGLNLSAHRNPVAYGRQKLNCEDLLRRCTMSTVVARLAPVLLCGPHGYASRLLRTGVFTRALSDESRVQFLAAEDAAAFLLQAAAGAFEGVDIVNVAAPDTLSAQEVRNRCKRQGTRNREITTTDIVFPCVSTRRLTDGWSFVCTCDSRSTLDREVSSWFRGTPAGRA